MVLEWQELARLENAYLKPAPIVPRICMQSVLVAEYKSRLFCFYYRYF